MIFIQLVVWGYFLGLTFLNSFRNPDRRKFLLPLMVVGSIWFVSLPLMVSFMHYAPFYYRWKVVLGLTQTFYVFCYIFVFLCAIPSPLSRFMRDDGIYSHREPI